MCLRSGQELPPPHTRVRRSGKNFATNDATINQSPAHIEINR
ncbi:hypothetical protein [Acidovorax delafieldii]|nr:hypothetical protein [Acidovorax delafieldii]